MSGIYSIYRSRIEISTVYKPYSDARASGEPVVFESDVVEGLQPRKGYDQGEVGSDEEENV
jgi:hypothetical protein